MSVLVYVNKWKAFIGERSIHTVRSVRFWTFTHPSVIFYLYGVRLWCQQAKYSRYPSPHPYFPVPPEVFLDHMRSPTSSESTPGFLCGLSGSILTWCPSDFDHLLLPHRSSVSAPKSVMLSSDTVWRKLVSASCIWEHTLSVRFHYHWWGLGLRLVNWKVGLSALFTIPASYNTHITADATPIHWSNSCSTLQI